MVTLTPTLINETFVRSNFNYLPEVFTYNDLKRWGLSEKMVRKIADNLVKDGLVVKHIQKKGAIKNIYFEKRNKRKRNFENAVEEFIKEITLPIPLSFSYLDMK